MPAPRMRWLLLPLALLLSSGVRAEDADDIPTVGRPADLPFSEASGDFRVWADAQPTTLEAQKPITLTLHVEARDDVHRPPRRIDLRALPSFQDRFTFEEIDGGERRPGPRNWEFVYRLHPKSEAVASVPGIPFVFYNPKIEYPRKGFQVAYTDPIRLTVAPPVAYVVPVVGPEVLFSCATGPSVTAAQGRWPAPGPWTIGTLASAPPLLCLAWYLGWRRWRPDAARLARQRRSLAARRALQALHAAGRLPPIQRAARAAVVTADYLRSRFDAPAEEPTPAEAADCLARAGCSAALAEQAAALFRDCDAARFAPLEKEKGRAGEREKGRRGEGEKDLPAEAARFILAVEAESWSASRS
ncbi:MAG TPA: hypothetical protein VMS17_03175 [Gemmataceae bacterium]|nr:hypothetical protein [Gemmataceae bacterium]